MRFDIYRIHSHTVTLTSLCVSVRTWSVTNKCLDSVRLLWDNPGDAMGLPTCLRASLPLPLSKHFIVPQAHFGHGLHSVDILNCPVLHTEHKGTHDIRTHHVNLFSAFRNSLSVQLVTYSFIHTSVRALTYSLIYSLHAFIHLPLLFPYVQTRELMTVLLILKFRLKGCAGNHNGYPLFVMHRYLCTRVRMTCLNLYSWGYPGDVS